MGILLLLASEADDDDSVTLAPDAEESTVEKLDTESCRSRCIL